MTRQPYARPKRDPADPANRGRPGRRPSPKPARRDGQLDIDQRCVACKAGVHRAKCMTAQCPCPNEAHRPETTTSEETEK